MPTIVADGPDLQAREAERAHALTVPRAIARTRIGARFIHLAELLPGDGNARNGRESMLLRYRPVATGSR